MIGWLCIRKRISKCRHPDRKNLVPEATSHGGKSHLEDIIREPGAANNGTLCPCRIGTVCPSHVPHKQFMGQLGVPTTHWAGTLMFRDPKVRPGNSMSLINAFT